MMILWILVAAGLGALFVKIGESYGRKRAATEIQLKAAKTCLEASDNPFARPTMVPCPCMCGGILQNDGRNRMDTLTFLVCSKCKCCYVAGDSEKREAAC